MSNKEAIQLYAALHRLGRQLHRCSRRVFRAEGHYRELSRLLLIIAENDGVIQRDLAEEMDVRPSSMTEMLAKMEHLGLITRRQDEKDQRVMHIHLTEAGKAEAEKSKQATDHFADALFQGLSEEEIQQMLALTTKLCDHLESIDLAESEREPWHGHHRGFGHPHGFGPHHGCGDRPYGHRGGRRGFGRFDD